MKQQYGGPTPAEGDSGQGWMPTSSRLDIHQHLVPPALADTLRRRRDPPLLDGSTLHRTDAPPTVLSSKHFDVRSRVDQTYRDGCDAALVSLSAPMGVENLPPDEAQPLLDQYHDSVARLPSMFRGWAATCREEPDLEDLDERLGRGFVGLQILATSLLTPSAVDELGPQLSLLERHDKPVLVHPGPAAAPLRSPPWWVPVVPFVQQLHAAWHAWRVAGPTAHPRLRVCFVALAGLAPLHHDRIRARGPAHSTRLPQNVFYETSSYGERTIDAVAEQVGREAMVYGSDRPYAEPSTFGTEADPTQAVRVANPWRLLNGGRATTGDRWPSETQLPAVTEHANDKEELCRTRSG